MGECILRLREERGYSLEELAGLTLSSPDELRKIESGTQQPDKMTLTLLSNVLNVYPDSLQRRDSLPCFTIQSDKSYEGNIKVSGGNRRI